MFVLLVGLMSPQSGIAQQSPRVAFLFPGEGARVTSPIQVSALVEPDPEGFIRLALLDQSGRTISRQLYPSNKAPQGSLNPFETFLPYEVPTPSTKALLTLSIHDRADRPIALRSVLVILQPGEAALMADPQGNGVWLNVTHPLPMEIITGDVLRIEGTIVPLTENPIFFELITSEGRVLATRQLPVQNPGETAEFVVNLVYQVSEPEQDVRLVIRQSRSPFGVTAILDSILLNLAP